MASTASRRGHARPRFASPPEPPSSAREASRPASPPRLETRGGQGGAAAGVEVGEDREEGEEMTDDVDEPPAVMALCPPEPSSSSSSTSSVNTYNSLLSEDDAADAPVYYCPDAAAAATPAGLPPCYRPPGPAPAADPALRASDSRTFAGLFPSFGWLAIRHDDASPDGNMNLRVETDVHLGPGRRDVAVQLFHLRMHNLARRHFSLRRYCRGSGREVCRCKRVYAALPPSAPSAALPRSVSAALRSVRRSFRRPSSEPASSEPASASSTRSSLSLFSRRPSTRGSLAAAAAQNLSPDACRASTASAASSPSATAAAAGPAPPPPASVLVPTDTIKLDFSNYAGVNLRRRRAKRYEFDWWGHAYAWERSVDKTLNTVSFHLVRDGRGDAVAHIVPQVRTPAQVDAEDLAGGWIPPCYMWISDPKVILAITNVADVIVATGLMALVDDCIRDRWQVNRPAPLGPARPPVADAGRSRSAVRDFFSRRPSPLHPNAPPLHMERAVAVY